MQCCIKVVGITWLEELCRNASSPWHHDAGEQGQSVAKNLGYLTNRWLDIVRLCKQLCAKANLAIFGFETLLYYSLLDSTCRLKRQRVVQTYYLDIFSYVLNVVTRCHRC